MDDKDLCFLGSSKQDIITFSDDARREAGYQLSSLSDNRKPTAEKLDLALFPTDFR